MSVKNRFESELFDFILIQLPINPCLLPDNVSGLLINRAVRINLCIDLITEICYDSMTGFHLTPSKISRDRSSKIIEKLVNV